MKVLTGLVEVLAGALNPEPYILNLKPYTSFWPPSLALPHFNQCNTIAGINASFWMCIATHLDLHWHLSGLTTATHLQAMNCLRTSATLHP